jgi:1-acyl-sn-glycerol-3-phosphate acyltransferase
MRTIRDWVFTIPCVLAFGLTLAVFDVAGRIVRPFSLRGFEYVMAALQRTLVSVFSLAGTKVHVECHPDIRPHTGYALISNHQSMLDIVMIGGFLFSNFPKYVAKKELGRGIPSVSLNLRWGGNALIDRSTRTQAVDAIRAMASVAQDRNVSVVIFPEGTRSRDGVPKTFKPAGAIAMLESADQLPVVPVTIDGSWKVFEKGMFPVPFGTRVRLRFGKPIAREPGDAQALLSRAEDEIRQTLDEWRTNT